MENIHIKFGQVIRARRRKLQISQEEFAAQAGIHRTYMSAIELGKVQISIAIAAKLATALNAKLSEIWKEVEKL